jgi:sugar/nucleoside kinase (ribokinase family)
MASGRLVNLDTVMMDMVLTIDSLPRRGGDAEVFSRVVTTGGGFNVMSAAARQGVAVTYAGLLGHGPFASIARTDLSREGIEAPLTDGDDDLGLCVVLVEASGERTFVTSPGAEQRVSADQLATVSLNPGDYVYLSGYNFVYPALQAHVLAWWRQLPDDVVVAFDPGPRVRDLTPGVIDEILARTDWLLLNEDEASALTASSEADVQAADLVERVRAGVVVHRGEGGCVLATKDHAPRSLPAIATQVVDTNGAGDTHNGVFLANVAEGFDPLSAARRANFAASVAIGRLGPAQSPARADVDAWYAAFHDA